MNNGHKANDIDCFAVMGKSQLQLGFKSRFQHNWSFDSNYKDSIQKTS